MITNVKFIIILVNKNVVVDALTWKEEAKPLHEKALTLTIHSNLTNQIRDAQLEALKPENFMEENM